MSIPGRMHRLRQGWRPSLSRRRRSPKTSRRNLPRSVFSTAVSHNARRCSSIFCFWCNRSTFSVAIRECGKARPRSAPAFCSKDIRNTLKNIYFLAKKNKVSNWISKTLLRR